MAIKGIAVLLTSTLISLIFCEVQSSDKDLREYLSKYYLMAKKASTLPCNRCMSTNFHWVSCSDCWSRSKSIAYYYERNRHK